MTKAKPVFFYVPSWWHTGSNSPLTLRQRVASGKQRGSYQYMFHLPPESDKISSVLQVLKSYCCIRKKSLLIFRIIWTHHTLTWTKKRSFLMLRIAAQCIPDYPVCRLSVTWLHKEVGKTWFSAECSKKSSVRQEWRAVYVNNKPKPKLCTYYVYNKWITDLNLSPT
jgi:hypothetical protein